MVPRSGYVRVPPTIHDFDEENHATTERGDRDVLTAPSPVRSEAPVSWLQPDSSGAHGLVISDTDRSTVYDSLSAPSTGRVGAEELEYFRSLHWPGHEGDLSRLIQIAQGARESSSSKQQTLEAEPPTGNQGDSALDSHRSCRHRSIGSGEFEMLDEDAREAMRPLAHREAPGSADERQAADDASTRQVQEDRELYDVSPDAHQARRLSRRGRQTESGGTIQQALNEGQPSFASTSKAAEWAAKNFRHVEHLDGIEQIVDIDIPQDSVFRRDTTTPRRSIMSGSTLDPMIAPRGDEFGGGGGAGESGPAEPLGSQAAAVTSESEEDETQNPDEVSLLDRQRQDSDYQDSEQDDELRLRGGSLDHPDGSRPPSRQLRVTNPDPPEEPEETPDMGNTESQQREMRAQYNRLAPDLLGENNNNNNNDGDNERIEDIGSVTPRGRQMRSDRGGRAAQLPSMSRSRSLRDGMQRLRGGETPVVRGRQDATSPPPPMRRRDPRPGSAQAARYAADEDPDAMTDDPRIMNWSHNPVPCFAPWSRSLSDEVMGRMEENRTATVRSVILHGGRLYQGPGGVLMRSTPEGEAIVRERRRQELHEQERRRESELGSSAGSDSGQLFSPQTDGATHYNQDKEADGAAHDNHDQAGDGATHDNRDSDSDDDDDDDGRSTAGSDSSHGSAETAIYVGAPVPPTPTPTPDPTDFGPSTPRASARPSRYSGGSPVRQHPRPLPVVPVTSEDGLDNSDTGSQDHEDDDGYLSLNDPSISIPVSRALASIEHGMAAPNPATNFVNATAPYALGGAAMLPPAGHHNDMQHIWSLVEELSSVLHDNRQRQDELQEDISRVQARPTGNGVLTNGDTNGSHVSPPHQDPTALSSQLADAQARVNFLENEYREQGELLNHYESTVMDIMDKLRNHSFDQQNATVALHAHYNQLLETSRSETIQAQLIHQDWQASLLRLSENLRLAQRANEEGSLPYRRRIAALKEENRVLRVKAGWEPASESDDSEDEDDDEEVPESA